MILEVELDENAAKSLREMSAPLGIAPAVMAARLIKRALRAARPKIIFDLEVLKAYAAEHGAEDLALAESDLEHRVQLLADEDEA